MVRIRPLLFLDIFDALKRYSSGFCGVVLLVIAKLKSLAKKANIMFVVQDRTNNLTSFENGNDVSLLAT